MIKIDNHRDQWRSELEIGVGDRQMLNLGDHRFEISGESTFVSLEFGENLISPSLN